MNVKVEDTNEEFKPVRMYTADGKYHIRFMPAKYLPDEEIIWI